MSKPRTEAELYAYQQWLYADVATAYSLHITDKDKHMKSTEMLPSKYLTKEEVGEEGVTATIKGLKKTNVARDDQPPEYKWEITFKELEKPMLANKTNLKRMFKFLGDDSDLWIGQQIQLFDDPNVEFKGEITGGIRVRKAPRTGTAKIAPRNEDDANSELRAAGTDQDDIPF